MHLHILTTSQQIVKHSAKTSDDCQRNNSHNHDDHQTFWNDCCQNRRQRIGCSRHDVKFIIHVTPQYIGYKNTPIFGRFPQVFENNVDLSKKGLRKNSVSNWKTGWFAINCKSYPVFLRMYDDRLPWWKSSKIVWRYIWLRACRWLIRHCIWQNHCRLRTHWVKCRIWP